MVEAILSVSPFSDDLMLLSWHINMNKNDNDWNKIKESILWKTMMNKFQSILKNTDNEKGWTWFKKYFIASNVWLLPHPNNDKLTLFNELLTRTQSENTRQGELLLTKKIKLLKEINNEDWTNLVKYNITNDLIAYDDVRQDAKLFINGIKAQYSETELEKYKSTATFNPIQHINLNTYLPQLLFYANIVDDNFQSAMQSIVTSILTDHKDIFTNSTDIDQRIVYKRGPVKQEKRSRAKVEVEYNTDENISFPSSARLLDLNRCSIEFDDINELLTCLNKIESINNDKEKNNTCIKQIVRCKNGWSI